MEIPFREVMDSGVEFISVHKAAKEKNMTLVRFKGKINEGLVDTTKFDDGIASCLFVVVNEKYILFRREAVKITELWKQISNYKRKKTHVQNGLSKGRAISPLTKNSLPGSKASMQGFRSGQPTPHSNDTRLKQRDGLVIKLISEVPGKS